MSFKFLVITDFTILHPNKCLQILMFNLKAAVTLKSSSFYICSTKTNQAKLLLQSNNGHLFSCFSDILGGGGLIWALGHAHIYNSRQSEVRHTAEAKDALAISLLSCTLWQTLATPRSCPISFFFLFFVIPVRLFVCRRVPAV